MRLLTVLLLVSSLFGCALSDVDSLHKQIFASDCRADQECENWLKYYGQGLNDVLPSAETKVFDHSILVYKFDINSTGSSVFYFVANNCQGDTFFREIENHTQISDRYTTIVLDQKSCALLDRIVNVSSTLPIRETTLVSSHPVPIILKRCANLSGEIVCQTDYFRNGSASIFRFMNHVIEDME